MSIVEQHKGLAQEILAEAQSQGAEQASLTLATATAFQVEAREASIDSLKEAGSSGIHLVLSQDGRRSSRPSNDLTLATLDKIADFEKSIPKTRNLFSANSFTCLPLPQPISKIEIFLRLLKSLGKSEFINLTTDSLGYFVLKTGFL